MQKVCVCFTDADETTIATYWGSPQDPEQLSANGDLSFPFYSELDSDDPRYVTWFDLQLTLLTSYITNSLIQPGT